jgi:tRNA pseudouridine(38-40) synthase
MDATKVNDPNAVPTIENEIRLAMLKAGLIIPSNSEDLSKIGWSRSSRTDKRVHAGRIVFSGKLEIPAHLLADVPSGDPQPTPSKGISMNYPIPRQGEAKKGKGPHYRPQIYAANEPNSQFNPIFFPEIVEKLNEQLPVDIRVYSCMKTTGNFQAKDAGYWREYEYLFPLSLLIPEANRSKDIDEVAIVNRFNSFLMNYEGIHYFHNFHRISMKELFKKDRGKRPFQSKDNNNQSKEAVDCRRDNAEKLQADNQDAYADDGEEDEEMESTTTVSSSSGKFVCPVSDVL